MSVGRNELCPCGSGKKYKRCCGLVTSISQVREQKLRQAHRDAAERLNKYVAAHFSREEIEQARQRFVQETGLSVEEAQHSQWAVHFYNWFVFDDRKHGSTVVEAFLNTDGRRLEGEIKEAFRRLVLGIYEIVRREGDQLTVRSLKQGDLLEVVAPDGVVWEPGQLLLGRLLPIGQRYQLFTGSIVLPAALKQPFADWLSTVEESDLSRYTTRLYRLLRQQRSTARTVAKQEEELVRAEWRMPDWEAIRETLRTDASFELKKREGAQEVWVYASHKEGGLLSTLNKALVELHEVAGEVLVEEAKLVFEGFPSALSTLAEKLPLPAPDVKHSIDKLSSTGTRLTQGTIFITSQPALPPKVLQWAVQTYFAEKWLITPHAEIDHLPPLLAAAAQEEALRGKLLQLVGKIERAREQGVGPGRFMRWELIRPRLALPNREVSVHNLLKRPLLEGLPEGSFTVHPDRLSDIATFVQEMTEGKSDSTMKKYDEAMNLFRNFVRSAFGRGFAWAQLRPEEVAYFLVHDVLNRVDSPTKTLAGNLLSVLSAFFKWLDKRYELTLTSRLQPVLTALKEELPEAYRLRAQLQKQAIPHLTDALLQPEQVAEEVLLFLSEEGAGWRLSRSSGEEILVQTGQSDEGPPGRGWLVIALIGQAQDGCWHLLGIPQVYPPIVAELLGVRENVLI
ncbi:MAG: SEC-C domain-containing protein [Brevibacillus sp.]|nr:SEC-C domain-containing protein [Brevibacillus sp.]